MPGPFALIATFCESLDYSHGVTIYSAFTGISQAKSHPDDPNRMHPIKRDLLLALVLTGGTVRGTGQLAAVARYPGLRPQYLPLVTVTFEDAYTMVPTQAEVEFSTEVDGMHFFDVTYRGRLLVTVPLRITFLPSFRTG